MTPHDAGVSVTLTPHDAGVSVTMTPHDAGISDIQRVKFINSEFKREDFRWC